MYKTKRINKQCPICKEIRSISIQTQYAINAGRCTDKCLKCANKIRKTRKDKYEVKCKYCGKLRKVSYVVYRRILKGETKGYCKECTIKHNKSIFPKNNIPWNKNINPNKSEDRRTYKLKWNNKNRDKLNAYFRNYYHSNLEKSRLMRRISRSKRRSAGEINSKTIENLLKEYSICYICGCDLTKYEIDHIIPIKLGGTNDYDNLALSCTSCNRKKNTKTLEEYLVLRENLLANNY